MQKNIYLLFLLIFLLSGCQSQQSIKYTIEESDTKLINKYNDLWTFEERVWINNNTNRYFVFVCAKDYTPLEYMENGNPSGLGINILRQVSKATGLKFSLYKKNLNEEWYSLLNRFKSKEIDILPTVSYSDARTQFLDFTKPYIKTTLVIVGHKDNAKFPRTLMNLKDYKLAIPKKYWLNEFLFKELDGNVDIYSVNNTRKAFEAVNTNMADYTICEIPIFTYYREKDAFKNLRIVGELEKKNPIMLGIQKDLPILKKIINKVIINIDKNQLFESSLVMPANNNNFLIILNILLSLIIIIISCLLIKYLHKLISTKKKLEISVRQKQKFMADISHDLKTPIMINMGYIDSIVDEEVKDKKAIINYLKRIQTTTLYLHNLVNDLFMLSKIENNLINLHKEKVSINKLLKEIVAIAQIKVDKKNIAVIMDLTSTTGIEAEIDSHRIKQVLTNILQNAVKFTNKNGKINITTKYFNGKIHISIKDSGNGIPKENLPYVFDRYYKSNNNVDKQSSGLGLNIAKKIITLHGGKIWAESLPGKGSTIFIELRS